VRPPPALRPILWPFSIPYGAAARLRGMLYRSGVFRQRRLDGTVISVGNLTVGGTGKTPMVLWIAERLTAEGHRPAILTRGYRGRGQSDAAGMPTSDEVALLRERLGARAQLGVGKNRYEIGRTLERHGAKWFILDDGFQHLRLARDADIVLLDSTDPFGGGQVLPAGRLREPRSALERADLVVITRSDHAPALETVIGRFTQAPIFYALAELESVVRAPAMVVSLNERDRQGAKFFAFCGIGNPAAFFDDLRRWGLTVTGQHSYRDHHRYSLAELRALEKAGAAAGADALICTEKDLFNLPEAVTMQMPVYVCRIRLRLSDPEGCWKAILDAIARNRSKDFRGAIRQEAQP
jgi:tetraacyldisaccharide 4'-kinase